MDAPPAVIQLPNREMTILGDALEAFTNTTGLEANLVAEEPTLPGTNHRADALVKIRGKDDYRTFFAEVRTVERTTTLGTLKERLTEEHGLLVTPYLTPELANHCRHIDLPFIDTAGNAYIKAPGLFVFVRGEKRPEAATLGTRGGGRATALRVVFALLCRPDLLNARYREIVDATGVALGAVGWVFFDLEGRGYVAGGKRKHNRQLLEPERLFDEWVTNYPIRLRPKLNPRRFRATDGDWWQRAELPRGAYWGGEVAADQLTNFLKPATFTIYLATETGRENLAALVGTHHLRADPAGDIEVLDTFWHFDVDPPHPGIVPPILVYADLVATLDPRNLEVAKLIRERFIADALRQKR